MPAPTQLELQAALRASFLSMGPDKFCKRDDKGNIVPNELQPALEDMIEAFARGLALQWATWQAAQTVVTPGVTPGGTTVVGTLP